jgi:galactokinase
MTIQPATIGQAFFAHFGRSAEVLVRSPGRVNLIGEHTDYNGGFVLPMAIDRAVWLASAARDDRRVHIYSLDEREGAEFSLADLRPENVGWIEYIKGVAAFLLEGGRPEVRGTSPVDPAASRFAARAGPSSFSGPLRGFDAVLTGDVPIGAGLSSSAALEMAAARLFAALGGWPWNPVAGALVCQKAENEWVGVNCGIMDQLACGCGRAGHALRIDCRSLEIEHVPLPPDTALVVLDTATRRGLADSAYNERRSQCQAAAGQLGVPALRDASLEQLERCRDVLDEAAYRRARHVIAENTRTMEAGEAMRGGDAAALGSLMDQSHASLRDDYEVSSPELDAMVACARAHPACYGARMTGAGFGGCAIALIDSAATSGFVADTVAAYRRQTGREPALYVTQASAGTAVISGSSVSSC